MLVVNARFANFIHFPDPAIHFFKNQGGGELICCDFCVRAFHLVVSILNRISDRSSSVTSILLRSSSSMNHHHHLKRMFFSVYLNVIVQRNRAILQLLLNGLVQSVCIFKCMMIWRSGEVFFYHCNILYLCHREIVTLR